MLNRATRALTLLLALCLGGLALPLAHELDHLVESLDVEQVAGLLAGSKSNSAAHDCDLCEVRVAAAEWAQALGTQMTWVALERSMVPASAQTSAVRCFDGRAPPVLA